MNLSHTWAVCPRCGTRHAIRIHDLPGPYAEILTTCMDDDGNGCDKQFAARIVLHALTTTAPVDFPENFDPKSAP